MSNKTIYHYVYRITNLVEKKHYYGKRTSTVQPSLDIGIRYFSSSKDKDFKQDQKTNPSHYRYKIVGLFETTREAVLRESKLHYLFDVGRNPSFYNKVKQTANRFDSTGTMVAKDGDGNIFVISVDDLRRHSGELVSIHRGKLCTESQKQKLSVSLKMKADNGELFREEHRKKLSVASKGKPKSAHHVAKFTLQRKLNGSLSGKNHHKSKYLYHTPFGVTDSPKGFDSVITMSRLKNWCINCDRTISLVSYESSDYLKKAFSYDFIKGKCYRDIGFFTTPS
jgi:hypothetical protein